MSETLQSPMSQEDITALNELAQEAATRSELSALREMVADQDGNGSVTIEAEDGTKIDVKSIGQERFADLGHQVVDSAAQSMVVSSESWRTEEK